MVCKPSNQCFGWRMALRYIIPLHMGYADEVLFGSEVVEEMPRIVSEWVEVYHQRNDAGM